MITSSPAAEAAIDALVMSHPLLAVRPRRVDRTPHQTTPARSTARCTSLIPRWLVTAIGERHPRTTRGVALAGALRRLATQDNASTTITITATRAALAGRLGVSRSTVGRARRDLIAIGVLTTRSRGRHGTAWRLRLAQPARATIVPPAPPAAGPRLPAALPRQSPTGRGASGRSPFAPSAPKRRLTAAERRLQHESDVAAVIMRELEERGLQPMWSLGQRAAIAHNADRIPLAPRDTVEAWMTMAPDGKLAPPAEHGYTFPDWLAANADRYERILQYIEQTALASAG